MAITLRGTKGTPLTQQELDVNFTEFFYSASVNGSEVVLHRFHYISSSANPSASIQFPIDPPIGTAGSVQLKKGDGTGADAVHTASANFTFDYNNDILQVNGQLDVTGSSNITGDLIVGGTVTAQEFKSELVSSSIVYQSGSTKFGDTSDDTHNFTGSINIKGDTNIAGALSIIGVPNVRTSIQALISTASLHEIEITQLQTDSGSFSTRVTALEDFSSSLDNTFTTDAELNASSSALIAADTALSSSASTARDTVSSSLASSITSLSSSAAATYLKSTTDTLTGDLTITGTLTANTYVISSSVTHLTTSFSSGSTQFGDSADDTHTFTGSVNISQNLTVVGNLTGNITGSASNASTASYIEAANIDGTIDISSQTNLSVTDTTGQTGINFTLSGDNITGTLAGLGTSADVQFDSLGIGTAASGTTGEIRATGDITAYYSSDRRLKDNITPISDAINKLNQIGGYEFDWNSDSSHSGHDVGVIAQEIEKVLPEVVTTRDNGYMAVRYEKIVALLIQAVKEQQLQIDELKSKL